MINQCKEDRMNVNSPVSTQKRINNELVSRGVELWWWLNLQYCKCVWISLLHYLIISMDRSLVGIGGKPKTRSRSQSEMLTEFRWSHVGESSDVMGRWRIKLLVTLCEAEVSFEDGEPVIVFWLGMYRAGGVDWRRWRWLDTGKTIRTVCILSASFVDLYHMCMSLVFNGDRF